MAGRANAERIQKLKDMFRALCILIWTDTNWNNRSEVPIDGVRIILDGQGIRGSAQYHKETEERDQWEYIDRLYNNGTRVGQLWMHLCAWQKSLAGTGLLHSKFEVITKPTPDHVVWAEDVFKQFNVSRTAGMYQVTIEGTVTARCIYAGAFNSPEAAVAEWSKRHSLETGSKSYLEIVNIIEAPKIVEVKKI